LNPAFRAYAWAAKVVAEISNDLAATFPMQRLLQETSEAARLLLRLWLCCKPSKMATRQLDGTNRNSRRAALSKIVNMAFPILEPLGMTVDWLTGQQKKPAQSALGHGCRQRCACHRHTCIVPEQVSFDRLGLVIIDEQHRFSVHQRLSLRKGAGPRNTAPADDERHSHSRTLSMSYYAVLSVADGLPPGRTQIITKLIAHPAR
jgi:ATP-dependent DNA helicase RecG